MTDLAAGRWRVIRDEPRSGAMQMALEEIAGETAVEDDLRTVRVYSWEPSTLSLGYQQDPKTVDWDVCDREGIAVTRRQTGGGGIYHDRWGDISYSIVAPAEEVPSDLLDCYAHFCEPIIDAFSRMGIDADFATVERSALYEPACYLRDVNPAHDVVAPASAGEGARKISGNAQYRRRDVVIQHGSLTYETTADRHLGVFAEELDPGRFDDRVTSIRQQAGIEREEAVETVARALCEWCDADEGDWRAAELEAARDLADRKYGSEEWIRDRTTVDGR